MNIISKTLNQEYITLEELFLCIEEVKNERNVFILKVDGESNINTIMITFPNSNKEMIRYDDVNLKEAIVKALKVYQANW